ncbi:uncharacterized protein LOC116308603 isoform X2 [Actinia tenebrosa]|uniref:Uncharacterized protein LOC116308603 isoform X2 n=1 Tax=Actinia tenebrosa TaxID=6105 RepID=A0A6P8JEV8_ACTTE|nr:uncharacterized protein LOC116308603 isoform X2 [Actinia tenebrosa]XP_031574945.1 uncharacterized protein LOC116308603 isoform X2 [Actinia tenebrosa]
MQPPSLRSVAQTIIVRTLVCRPTDCIERQLLLETLKTTKGTCLSEEILLLVAELFPKELTDELLCVLAPEHLRHLKLKDCSSLTCDGVIETITKCSHLTYIDFSSCENLLRPVLYCCLKDNAPNITHLSFEDCNIMTDDGVQIILMCCPGLEHLNISSCNNITDKAFAMSSSSPPNKSSKSPPKLSQRALQGGKNLTSVDLSGCQSITSAAIKNLVALCGPTLTSVNISWTGLGCIALLYLAGLSPQAAFQFVQEVDSSYLGALSSLTENEDSGSDNDNDEELDQENQDISVKSNKAGVNQSSYLEKDEHLRNSFPAVKSTNGTYYDADLHMKDSSTSGKSNFEKVDFSASKSGESERIEKEVKATNLESTKIFTKEKENSECWNAEDDMKHLNGSGEKVDDEKMGITEIDSTEIFKKCEDSNAEEYEYDLNENGKIAETKSVGTSDTAEGQITEFVVSTPVRCQDSYGKDELQENIFPRKEAMETETTTLEEENENLNLNKTDMKSEVDFLNSQADNSQTDNIHLMSLSFPTVGLPLASTLAANRHRPPKSSDLKVLEEEWMLAWQQVGDDDSCSDNDELFDSMWGDVHKSSHVNSVSSVFGDAISCLTSALVNLDSTDDDDDDDTKVLQQPSISTSHISSRDGDGDDGVQGNDDADDDDDDTKVLQQPSISTSHISSCDGDGDDGVQGDDDADNDDDDDTKVLQQPSISMSHISSCDGDGDDGVQGDDDADNGGGVAAADGDGGDDHSKIIVTHDGISESSGNVGSCAIDNGNQRESLDDADDLFTDILNLQEWRTEDSSSLLHGFNDALLSLSNAMFELMDSDDDDEDDDDGGDGDDADGFKVEDDDGDDDGDDGDDDDDDDADEAVVGVCDGADGGGGSSGGRDAADDGGGDDDDDDDYAHEAAVGVGNGANDSVAAADDTANDTCRVDSLNPLTLEQINLVMLSQDDKETYPNILDGENSSASVQNSNLNIQDFEKQNISNISTKEASGPDNKLTGSNILDVSVTVSTKSNLSIDTRGSEEENYFKLNKKSDTLGSELSCEGNPDVGHKTSRGEESSCGRIQNESESSIDSFYNTNAESSSSSKDDSLTVPYVTERSEEGKEPLILTLTYKPRLRSLDITSIHFHGKALGVACLKLFFSVNRSLNSFAVSWSELDDETLVAMVSNQPELRSLTLTDCEKLRDQSLLSLPVHCPLLESIDLRGVAFVTDLGVVPMLDCPRLKTLSLAETSVTDITMFALAEKCGDKLRDLDLSWCEELTDRGRCAMAESCTGLQSFALRQCTASRITMETLSIYCQSMTSLNVSSVGQLTDEVVTTMVTSMPNLTFVDISWNPDITSTGVGALLTHCGRLEEAVLSGLKALTTKPFFGIISDLPRWRTKQEIMLRRILKNKQNEGPTETYIQPCDMSECN